MPASPMAFVIPRTVISPAISAVELKVASVPTVTSDNAVRALPNVTS